METVCLLSVTQCSERDVALGLARKESSLRLKLVILLQQVRDFSSKYTYM